MWVQLKLRYFASFHDYQGEFNSIFKSDAWLLEMV